MQGVTQNKIGDISLLPLLNRNCKAVAMTLPAASKFNYKLLKAEILASASHSTKHTSKETGGKQ